MLVARHRKAAWTDLDAGPDPRVRELCATTVLISAAGEIDACNADEVAGRIESGLAGYRQLVLDLTAVTFCGTAGYAVLSRLDTYCRHAGLDWVLVPGNEVQRLLRICDPGGRIPTAGNIVAAAARLTSKEFRTA